MKRIAISAVLAGGIFLGALGAAGAAQATEIHVGPNGAGVTAVDGSGIAFGPNGVQLWLPDAANGYDGGYYDGHRYDGRYYDGRYYDRYEHPYRGCYSTYCPR